MSVNVPEFFDGLIEYIEQRAGDPYTTADALKQAVRKKSRMDQRELDSVFKFLLGGYTVDKYIKARKMMAAYAHLMEKSPSKDTAMSIAGYVEEGNFGTAFKKKFKCTPTEAMKKRDCSKIESPPYWDCISGILVKEQKLTRLPSLSLPISPEEAKKAQEVWTWKSYYDLDGISSDYACDLAKGMGCSLEKAFCFVNDLRDIGVGIVGWEEDEDDTPVISKTQLMKFGNDSFFRHMFFERDVLPSTAVRYDKNYFHVPPVPRDVVVKATPAAVKAYHPFCDHYYYLPFDLFVQGWDYYHAHADESYTDEDLETFYDMLRQCYSVEEAFCSLVPSNDFPTTEELDGALSSATLDEAELYCMGRGEKTDET